MIEERASLKTQLSRFIGVGIISAIVDLGLTLILQSLGLHRQVAKGFGWVAGTATAYVLNSKWTFNTQTSTSSAIAVGLLYLSTFAVQNFLYWVTDSPLHALGLIGTPKDVVAFVIAQGVATITNFVVQRVFIFK
ncbi:membrane protein [Corynebacterium kutscheri]|uniref:Membrane protein n=1 Tax=Corynebacterium kutscheri TaxID=35755 RepID=A0A0F6QY08_9CORY|nr:GtrA family protein [Corynebacterium kutscheri]AKE40317.1 putative membrane protein [Corynebacterium kutscheri]VEH05450.1 membrane protein [Corynebacterium kutscheri]VEH10710.1 membrane protein [Corynebacterium kutscheri]VEH80804.1 membrane protein [Corynebacterium kutscheri]